MSASFKTLFRRSRYSFIHSGADNPEEERRNQEQRERFAVAMIGLALQHDAPFRVHFLEKICNMKKLLATSPQWLIDVEPKNWGDLVLTHRQEMLVVVEFKIMAKLKDHQNPEKPAFFIKSLTECNGYGFEIDQLARKEGFKNSKYVTVQGHRSWDHPLRNISNLDCISGVWNSFLRPHLNAESTMEKDVYDTLAYLGVGIFSARNMKNKRLAAQATEPFDLLKAVLARLQVELGRQIKFDCRLLKYEGDQAFGFNLWGDYFPNLKKEFALRNDPIGWFGYESDKPKGPRLSVYLYCNQSYLQRGKDKLSRLPVAPKIDISDDGKCIAVNLSAEKSTDDLDWFVSVISALNTES